MKGIRVLMLTFALLASGCASQQVPVAVSCPKPPAIPEVLSEPATTGPSLMERFEASLKQLKESLEKARRQ